MARLRIACFVGLVTFVAALNARSTQEIVKDKEKLVFVHVPYNFGHTVELTRAFPKFMVGGMIESANAVQGITGEKSPTFDFFDRLASKRHRLLKLNSDSWGHLNTDLKSTSNVTGCPLYLTPQKYWPEHTANEYFKHNKVFGLLRDPYDRLMDMFRRGVFASKFFEATCDANGAIQQMMNKVIKSNDPFMNNCSFIPQAEYFEGPNAITLPVDSRRFPQSMNEVFENYGYKEDITADRIFKLKGCGTSSWVGNLTPKTRQLVKKVYARDFELLCKHFGYCDQDENTCVKGAPSRCPDKLFKWDDDSSQYIERQSM